MTFEPTGGDKGGFCPYFARNLPEHVNVIGNPDLTTGRSVAKRALTKVVTPAIPIQTDSSDRQVGLDNIMQTRWLQLASRSAQEAPTTPTDGAPERPNPANLASSLADSRP